MTAFSLPSGREEAWRWADLSALPVLADQVPSGAGVELPAALADGPRLVFIDGRLDAARCNVGPLEFGPVDVRSEHPLGRLATGSGWTLRLGRDRSAPGLVEIGQVGTGGASHLPGLIALEDDAQAAIVETFVGDGWGCSTARSGPR